MAQTELTVLGGATGADVFCLQAGNPATGGFVGTFLQTGPGAWEERSKAGTFKFEEKSRGDLMVELFDSSRSASAQIDFVTKTVRQKPSSDDAWTDVYVILNATEKAASADCVSSAALSAATSPSSEEADAADATDEERSKDSNAKTDKPSKRKKDAESTSKKRRKTAERPAKQPSAKKKSSSGFSIGIGGGGVGIGF